MSDSLGPAPALPLDSATAPPPPAPPPPGAAVPPSNHRTYACVLHLSAFVAPILGPVVLWLLQKDESPFVDHHGREAVNFHLTQAGIALLAVVFGVCTFGLGAVVVVPLLAAMGILDLVATIVAAVRANEGALWRYPMTFRIV